MNTTHTITFENVTVPETFDPDGNLIAESSSYQAFVLRVWNLDNPSPENAPFLLQPFDHRTGNPFGSEQEAEDWWGWYLENILTPAPPTS